MRKENNMAKVLMFIYAMSLLLFLVFVAEGNGGGKFYFLFPSLICSS